ncbi:glucosamine-6-phosphate deaminase [Planctomicrobium sp. SH668]|uniref:glucosamine-6-phosphate deaminase n=1 Tax=Planctomicrobium sp. SH668 TaxID=3448126 RepID=UPI003F5C90B1
MNLVLCQDSGELGRLAAETGATALRRAIAEYGESTILVATGASQFETLKALVAAENIDWSRVTVFHLDEYIGIDENHPASFRRYLQERFVSLVPLKQFYPVNGNADPVEECQRLSQLIEHVRIDLAFIGIGENAHLAFNDPPADFETTVPYLVVNLDDACRQQQFAEGWFESFDAVPKQAISMSVAQILKAHQIVCSVPGERKVRAVQQSLEGPVDPQTPASILQLHPDCSIFLDPQSASGLKQEENRL